MLPIIICSAQGIETGSSLLHQNSDEPDPELPEAEPESTETYEQVSDRDIPLAFIKDGEIEDITMESYLMMVLPAEMPASFEDEALKAQAVAARTYALHFSENRKSNHPDADVCDDPSCCAAALSESELYEKWGDNYDECYEKILSAVSETDGQYLIYSGETILAVFHASSEGVTESGSNIWDDLPYLQSVDTPETAQSVSNLHSTVEVSTDDFRQTVLSLYPDASLGDEPSQWVGESVLNSSGRVGTIYIGGIGISGTAVRNMFSLRSSNFTLRYEEGMFVFEVSGYGHGVGMSQYGANILASEGESYADILSHYYPGTELVVSVIVKK